MELKIDNVSKGFKDFTAVDNFSLTLTPGIWGLLGANGRGKTTLMRMITGITQPDSGQVLYDGIPVNILKEKYRNILGYLPQEFGFYPEFTVNDYLEYISVLKGLSKKESQKKINELLDGLSLSNVKNKKIIKLSGGMKRRVGIAQALLNEPELLILDEPTSGLDPGERVRLRKLLSEFSQSRIVLISTHIVSDVENISTGIAIMKKGKLLASGTTSQLIETMAGKVWTVQVYPYQLLEYESRLTVVNVRNEDSGKITIRYISDRPYTDDSISVYPNLEDLYLWMFPREEQESEEY